MGILVFLLALLAVVLAGVALVQRYKLRNFKQLNQAHEARRLLAQARGTRAHQPRYEIQVLELGSQSPSDEQKYRASVWDADNVLRAVAYPEVGDPDTELDALARTNLATRDPEGVIGIDAPYIMCDGPTYEAALLAADAWISEQGAETVVLTSDAPHWAPEQPEVWSDTPPGEPRRADGIPSAPPPSWASPEQTPQP
jgi:hypothetical protein